MNDAVPGVLDLVPVLPRLHLQPLVLVHQALQLVVRFVQSKRSDLANAFELRRTQT